MDSVIGSMGISSKCQRCRNRNVKGWYGLVFQRIRYRTCNPFASLLAEYALCFLSVYAICRLNWLYLASQSYQAEKQTEMIVYGILAFLFQPFFKIALGREIRNVVDVIVGVGLLALYLDLVIK